MSDLFTLNSDMGDNKAIFIKVVQAIQGNTEKGSFEILDMVHKAGGSINLSSVEKYLRNLRTIWSEYGIYPVSKGKGRYELVKERCL